MRRPDGAGAHPLRVFACGGFVDNPGDEANLAQRLKCVGHPLLTDIQEKLLREVLGCAMHRRVKVYLAGGLVRDLLRAGAESVQDIDFVVEGDAPAFARQCQETLGGDLQEHAPFGTACLSGMRGFAQIESVDFASTRTETYEKPGALPTVSCGVTIQEDLKRRDFSVNAMAVSLSDLCRYLSGGSGDLYSLKERILDPLGGMPDLESRLIRVLHQKSFLDDPTRIFRALRYATRLGASLEVGTRQLMLEALRAGALETISGTRIANDLEKSMKEEQAADLLVSLGEMGIFSAAGFCEDREWPRFVMPLETIKDEPRAQEGFEYLAALFLSGMAQEKREAFLLRYSLGRKFLHRMRDVIERKFL